MTFIKELQRRNVPRVGIAYVAVAWLLIQVVETVFPFFGISNDSIRLVIIVLAIGLIPALIFAWAFELTPEGLKKDKEVDRDRSIAPQTGKKLDRMIMVMLALALGFFAFDKFVLDPDRDAERVEAASEAAVEKAFAEAEAALPERSIAVLPFADMSQEGNQEYFSDGLAEELLNLLAKIPELRVISRSSAFSFKGKDLDISTIASQLKVRHILEGSVRKQGDQIRITAQLIDAHTDAHLWSETYDRALDNIFAVQDEISATVVEKLKISLLKSAPTSLETDPGAFELFLQARHLGRQGSSESMTAAVELYKQALDIDPGYAPAWAGLASTYNNLATKAKPGARAPIFSLAKAAAERAIAIDPEFGYAYSVLGWNARVFEKDVEAAALLHQESLRLDPGNLAVISNAASLLSGFGKQIETLELRRYVADRDPLNPLALGNYAANLYYNRLYSESEEVSKRVVLLSPRKTNGYFILGLAQLMQGKFAEALEAFEQEPFIGYRLIGASLAQHALGNDEASESALNEAKAMYKDGGAGDYARVYAYRGEIDLAFDWLEKELETSGRLPFLFNFDPLLNVIHEDPRWSDIAERGGIASNPLDEIDFKVDLPTH